MDSTGQQPFHSSSTPVSPLSFCAFCLRTNVEFFKQIVECSPEQGQCFRQILGYDFRLEMFAVCEACWRVMELVQEFRLRCLKANCLVQRACQGKLLLWAGGEEVPEILAATVIVRKVLAEQVKQIERLKDIFEEPKERVEIDLTVNEEDEREPEGGALESTIEVEEVKVEPEKTCTEKVDFNLECRESLPKEMDLESSDKRNESSYKCKLCNTSFKEFHLLVNHRQSHMENPPYRCWRHCSKSCPTVENRLQHEETCGKDARNLPCSVSGIPSPVLKGQIVSGESQKLATNAARLVLARIRKQNEAKTKKDGIRTVKKTVDLPKGQSFKGLKLKSIQIKNP